MRQRIYLDNAATSWPKRQSVLDAAWQYAAECGATAGRGSYTSSMLAQRQLSEARQHLANLIGSPDPRTIAFCSSGTHALNAALAGVLKPGDHVIATEMEHNSVLRPLEQLAKTRRIQVSYARCDSRGLASTRAAAELVTPQTRWIVVGHASNVTGAVHDLDQWSQFAAQCQAGLIVDASQTLGYLPIDVQALDIRLLAAAGHKGLGGVAGTGFLFASNDLHPHFQPLMSGGTGVHSDSIEPDTSWPHVIEVGNHNLLGIVSMGKAAQELVKESELSPVPWQNHWRGLMRQLISGLQTIPSIHLVGISGNPVEELGGTPHSPASNPVSSQAGGEAMTDRVPLVSLTVEGWDVHDLAMILDSQFGIEVRSGLHCAALVHTPIGSQQSGGTLRLSPGHSTTEQQIETTLNALRQILSG